MTRPAPSEVGFKPQILQSMMRGARKLTDAVCLTLGPGGQGILHVTHRGSPEVLSSGEDIARRYVGLARSEENVGTMLIREMILRQGERAGDGTAIAAALFRKLFNDSARYVNAGGDPHGLRRSFEKALPVICAELNKQAFTLQGKSCIAGMAASFSQDPSLSGYVSDAFDTVGRYGQIDLRVSPDGQSKNDYVDGCHWNTSLLSRDSLIQGAGGWVDYRDAAVFLSDYHFEHPRALLPILDAAQRANVRHLVVLATQLSPKVAAILLANSSALKIRSVVVKLPGLTTADHMAALEDLAVITGATPFSEAADTKNSKVQADDFGHVRRARASVNHLWLTGGRGDPRRKRAHLEGLLVRLDRSEDAGVQRTLQGRVGKLLGASVTLWVGGETKDEMVRRKALAQRTLVSVRAALKNGVVPGGGVALLACVPEMERRMRASTGETEELAYRFLIRAMAEPARTIMENSGYNASNLEGGYPSMTGGRGFDVVQGQVVDMVEANILDSVDTLKMAVVHAVSTAGLALTAEVVVYH